VHGTVSDFADFELGVAAGYLVLILVAGVCWFRVLTCNLDNSGSLALLADAFLVRLDRASCL
jgi:hypothetical protein